MAKSYRQERVNETIREILSELILNGIKDPRVGLVTITSVRTSRDLTSAKVYFSVMGDEEQRSATQKGLVSARNFMRTTIARELKVKNSPELRFVYDDTLDKSFMIEETLRQTGTSGAPDDDGDNDNNETHNAD